MKFIVSAPQHIDSGITITPPASKSLSNRAIIMRALTKEDCTLTNLSDCDDTAVMLRAFADDNSETTPPRTVDIGAAGTSMRFLTAYFATRPDADVIMTGSERMKQRPIKLLVDALRTLGADIEYTDNEGFPPLRIHGKQLAGGALTIDGSVSSQYISALLMVAPTLTNGLTLTLSGNITSVPYIQMTLQMMHARGIQYDWTDNVITIAHQDYQPLDYQVEGDWSASSYWFQVQALANCKIQQMGLDYENSLQGDSRIAQIYDTVINTTGKVTLDLTSQPDLAQTIICMLCGLERPFSISGLHTLRIKETDRVAALEAELRKLGYIVTDRNESGTIVMEYDGPHCTPDAEPVISTYKDHRMAMAFAPLSLVRPDRTIRIDDPAVVSKSYPSYWQDLKTLGFSVKKH